MRLLNRTAGRLSRHRRGPLAGLAVLLLGLLISGSLYTALAPAQAKNQASETDQIAQGKELFLASCAFCHGKNGEGVPTVRDGYQIGPSLVGVGAAAGHGSAATVEVVAGGAVGEEDLATAGDGFLALGLGEALDRVVRLVGGWPGRAPARRRTPPGPRSPPR